MSDQQANGAASEQQGPQFAIQRVYTKDISFEAPNTPDIFKTEWKPEVKLDLDTRSNKLEDGVNLVYLFATHHGVLHLWQQGGVRCNVMGGFCASSHFSLSLLSRCWA